MHPTCSNEKSLTHGVVPLRDSSVELPGMAYMLYRTGQYTVWQYCNIIGCQRSLFRLVNPGYYEILSDRCALLCYSAPNRNAISCIWTTTCKPSDCSYALREWAVSKQNWSCMNLPPIHYIHSNTNAIVTTVSFSHGKVSAYYIC